MRWIGLSSGSSISPRMLINENKILRYLAKTYETLHHLRFETDEIDKPFEAEGERVGKQNKTTLTLTLLELEIRTEYVMLKPLWNRPC